MIATIFAGVIIILKKIKEESPLFRVLYFNRIIDVESHKQKSVRQIEEDELFYESYAKSHERASSEVLANNNNSYRGDSYLSASDYKLQKQQRDDDVTIN